MRLLFILPEYLPASGGGIITFYRYLLPALAARGNGVRVIAGSGLNNTTARESYVIDGVEVETLEQRRVVRHWDRLAHLGALPTLRRYLAGAWATWEQSGEGEGAELIETTDWGLLFLPAILAAPCHVVVQLHGSCGQIDSYDPSPIESESCAMIRLLELEGLSRADRLQTTSQANGAFWHRQIKRDIEVIAPLWTTARTSAKAYTSDDVGLVVGRIQHWKGPHVLCGALRLMGRNAPVIRWVGRDTPSLVGGGTVSEELHRLFPDIWGISVQCSGPAPPDEVQRLQRRSSFVVVPSSWDVFNFTCVEAMTAGAIVICSTGAGASELVRDGENGFVFVKDDVASLADAMMRVRNLSPTRRSEISTAAQESIGRALDPDSILERRLAAYRAAMQEPNVRTLESSDFLSEACAERDDPRNEMAFLAGLPLRALIRHSCGRVVSKLTGRAP